METQRRRNSSVGGVEVAHKKVKATNECGVDRTGIRKNQFPMQQHMTMMPPHYFPPHQYPPGHFPGYPMYPPPMPYPQMYGYHQYPPHMNVNMMRQPHNVMPPGFAKPPAPACVPQATSYTKDVPYKVEAKNGDGSARAGKTLDQTNSRSITPTVSTETLVSNSPSDTPPVVMKKKTETMINSQVSLQGSTSDDSEDDTTESKEPFKNSGNDLAANGRVLKEKEHITVNKQEGTLFLKSQKKQDNFPCSSPSEKEEVIQQSQKEIHAYLHEDGSTTTYDCAVQEEEEKSEVKVDDIGDSLVLHCADTNRQVLEGVESLLLLSRVAEKRKPSEDESNMSMGSIHKQQSGQGKPLKKRKLQLPMRTDRKEGPLPKRMPTAPQRTPAFFHFLLHHKESIEQTIFSDRDASCGLERSEMVAKEGAMWWLASSEDEKQRWADISTQNYLGLLS
eukprot:CAMPEP_0201727684 /NCGR_PEP_ID=MMETSP0593-20130828/13174_1 /ASSEMBLY_ACC=CAM_ASM_000672 /TAXON_ID=267983 /ORGANISM="Skeletonema japonicum, Strain CCMP2506" /LENGTH=447 /DNA_ID=CAMNT_0048219579 /DNA_START=1 /DNA_END=1344 /DNA_ORIENTATION=+